MPRPRPDSTADGPAEESAAKEGRERRAHWQAIYAIKGEHGVSWFQDCPEPSLTLIQEIGSSSSGIIDMGGGASRLVDGLLRSGFRDLTVLDLSSSALAAAQVRLRGAAEQVRWIVADATGWTPARSYDIWHDRATFHFLVAEDDRAAYLARLGSALRPGGHAIFATFAPDGPERCSGLPVMRYDSQRLGQALGPRFRSVSTLRHEHVTPWGSRQAFQYSVFRHRPGLAP